MRAGLVDADAARPAPADVLDVALAGVAASVERGARGELAIVRAVMPAAPVPAEVRVVAAGPGLEEGAEVSAAIGVRSGSWLDDPQTFTRPPATRSPNLNVDVGADPKVELRREPTDACALQSSAVAPGGVVPLGLPHVVYVRLTDAAGAPAAGVALTLAPRAPAAGAPAVRTTDGLGVAAHRVLLEGPITYDLRFDCAGATVARTLEVAPSWDGVGLRPVSVTPVAGEPIAFEAQHQRGWGTWHTDLWCDGAWVATDTRDIESGPSAMAFDPQLPPSAVRLCLAQGYLYLFSPDPPRAVAYVLVRDRATTPAEAVSALVAAAVRLGAPALRAQLGPATRAALRSAPHTEVEQLGAWLVASLPQPFFRAPLLVDDTPRARAAFDAEKRGAIARLTWVLVADTILLGLGLLVVIAPRAAAQRAALAREADALCDREVRDDAPTTAHSLDGGAGAARLLALGLFSVAVSVAGLVVLLRTIS